MLRFWRSILLVACWRIWADVRMINDKTVIVIESVDVKLAREETPASLAYLNDFLP